jgi:hypothetical protein
MAMTSRLAKIWNNSFWNDLNRPSL